MAVCISGVEGSRRTRITGRPSGHLWLSNLKTLVRSAADMPPVLLVLSTITASCLASDEAPRLAASKSKTQIRLPRLMFRSLCRNGKDNKITEVIGALLATGCGKKNAPKRLRTGTQASPCFMNAKTAPSRIFKSGENGRIFDFYVFRERAISCHIVLAEAFARHETTYQSQSRKPIGAEPTARLLLGDLRAETLAHLLSASAFASASAASADRA